MKDNSDELKANEEKLLAQYLLKKNINTEPRSSGLYYLPVREGSGELPAEGNMVLVNYSIKDLSDRILYTTIKDTAAENSLDTTGRYFGAERWIIKLNTTLMKGFIEGLSLMRDSGVATLITPSELAFKQYGCQGLADPYQTLVWDVEMVRVVKDPAAYEQELIKAYLDTIPTDYDSTSDGIIKITDKPGLGSQPTNETAVAVQYKLFLIEGYQITEVTSDYWYTIGNTSGYIAGWDKAMQLIRPGEECRIIMPFDLAYGENSYQEIPPYATLVYQIKRTH